VGGQRKERVNKNAEYRSQEKTVTGSRERGGKKLNGRVCRLLADSLLAGLTKLSKTD